MFTSFFDQKKSILVLPKRSENILQLHLSRNVLIAFAVSVLVHLAVLWFFQPKLFSMGAPQKDAPPLEITLGPPQKKAVAPSELVLPDLRPLPQPPIKTVKPKSVKKAKTKKLPVDIVKKSETKIVKREKVNKEQSKVAPQKTTPEPLPGEDMQAFVRRQQKARLAAQGASEIDVEEVLASNNPLSAGQKRDAKILKNLNLNGTNGIFEIRELKHPTAQFSFKGWKNNINTARLEIINVTAPETVNIRRAVVRKIIEIIRREYSGDFNWDSRRLGRVLKLSAHPKDNAELEGFMMSEFFGPASPYR